MRDNTVYFYLAREPVYGCFSNFSPHTVVLDGVHWRTSEHYFQAQKFKDSPVHLNAVMTAPTPGLAARYGRDRERPLRPDWEDVKDDVMRTVLHAKFTQRESLRSILLGTAGRDIVERTTYDYYWGCGTQGTGKNMLGRLLVELREQLLIGSSAQ